MHREYMGAGSKLHKHACILAEAREDLVGKSPNRHSLSISLVADSQRKPPTGRKVNKRCSVPK